MVHPVSNVKGVVAPVVPATQAGKPKAGSATSATPQAVPTPVLSRMVEALVQQGPPVDFARVAQLRQAIADGSYAVDPRQIARAMIGFGKAG